MYEGEIIKLYFLAIYLSFNSGETVLLFGFLHHYRAGHKLEAAIEQLGVDVTGKVALDSGLSTGGFTNCLLQYDASHVYGVDMGYGQVFQSNPRQVYRVSYSATKGLANPLGLEIV